MNNALFSIGIGIAAGLLALPAVSQKFPDTRLDRALLPTDNSSAPQISSAGSNVYVVWQDNRNGADDIYFNRSTDGGETWLTSDLRLDTDPAGAADSILPQISSSGNHVYVVWEEARNSLSRDIYFNRSIDGGATWLPNDIPVDTNLGKTLSLIPQITSDGSNVYVVWRDDRSAAYKVYFDRSTDGGLTWLSSDVRVDANNNGACFNPEIAVSGGNVYVVWQDDRNGRDDVYFNGSTDGGVTWPALDVRLDSAPPGLTNSWFPQVRGAGSKVYVTWSDFRSGSPDIYFNGSADGGATWRPSDLRLDSGMAGLASSERPQIAADGDNVHVVWYDDRGGDRDIYYNHSTTGGNTWLASDFRVDTDLTGGNAQVPRIATTGNNVYVVWYDYRNGSKADIYFNRSTDGGANWLKSDVRLDADGLGISHSFDARVASGGTHPYVVWQDRRSGPGYDIYFNIPFGFHAYGLGTAGSGGQVPQLVGGGFATLGSTVALFEWNGLGGAVGAMFIGGGRISTPYGGGTLFVLPRLTVTIGLGGPVGLPGLGSGALPLPVPNDATLVGAKLNFQALFLDPGAPLGLSMTNGIEMWIG